MGGNRAKPMFENKDFQYIIEVDFQLYSFTEYIQITEEIIENEVKQKLTEYEKFLKESSREEIENCHDFTDHEIKHFTHQLYYHSIFIALYSFLERKMYQLCKIAEDKHLIKVKDLSDDGIFKYYKYLKKVLHLDLDELNERWTILTKYNKLRNRLVHHPTNTIEKNDNNRKLITILQSINNLSITDKGEYFEFEIKSKQLLLDFRGSIGYFLDRIYWEKAI